MVPAGKEHQRETVAVIALRYFGDEQGVVADVVVRVTSQAKNATQFDSRGRPSTIS
jgi:hypothetical protein